MDNSIQVGLDALSSGERMIFALASAVLKAKVDELFPSLLLLDEVDAPLHPSMCRMLLHVLGEELNRGKNLKIILVTHSASTVALAPEECIYVMNRTEPRITKSTKKDALNVLTEGFASLTESESNLQVTYNIDRSSNNYVLLTEGITDRVFVDSAWKLLEGKRNFDIQECFDAAFLRNMIQRGDIFKSHPDKKFVALFDFDKEGYDSWNQLNNFTHIESDPHKGLLKKHKTANAYALLLPVPSGSPVSRQVIKSETSTFDNESRFPIELLFLEVASLSTYFVTETTPGGGSTIKFQGDKVEFANYVKTHCISSDFMQFKDLFIVLKSIFR